MKFFIDTANLEEIKAAAAIGVLDGVTTNPSLAARESMPYHELLAEICKKPTSWPGSPIISS